MPQTRRLPRTRYLIILLLMAVSLVAVPHQALAVQTQELVSQAKNSVRFVNRTVRATITKRYQLWSGYFAGIEPAWSGDLQVGTVYRYTTKRTDLYASETFYFVPKLGSSNNYCLYIDRNHSLRWRALGWPAYNEYYQGRMKYTKYGFRNCGYASAAAARAGGVQNGPLI